jgi:predicted porin
MNKKLLAVAIGAALASAPMFANAALTAYGKLNVGIAMIDNGNNTPATEGNEILVTDDASRLGFKGEEDLGNGLKGLYMWETTIDVDNGGVGGARDTFVGLGGGFGTVRIGYYNTAYKNVSIPTEFFGDTIADFTANGFSGETRQQNNIGYTSPTFGGFKLGLEYSTGTETGLTATQTNPMNASVTWSNNAFYVAAGYYDYDLLAANGLSSAMKASAMATLGGFKIAATYEDQSGDGNIVVVDTANLAGMFTMGNHQFALTYSMYMADANGTSTAVNADCSMYGAGYFYNLSKTNAVKVIYNQADNDAAAPAWVVCLLPTRAIACRTRPLATARVASSLW